MNATSRLDWEITQTSSWKAIYAPTGHTIIARTESELMSKINKFDKESTLWRLK